MDKTYCKRISDLDETDLGLSEESLERIKEKYGSVAECLTQYRISNFDFAFAPDSRDINGHEDDIKKAFLEKGFLRSNHWAIWDNESYRMMDRVVKEFFFGDCFSDVAKIWYEAGVFNEKYEEFGGFPVSKLFGIFEEELSPLQSKMVKFYLLRYVKDRANYYSYSKYEMDLLNQAAANIRLLLKDRIIREVIL